MPVYELSVNGAIEKLDIEADMPLLWALRDELGLVGTKYGCGIAQCGACTVHVGGVPMRACSVTVAAIAGQPVTTIEGLADGEALHPLQEQWIKQDVPQCGYCQAGQIMSAAALLANNASPSDADIDQAMAGNYCRCGTYIRVRSAIHAAADQLSAQVSDLAVNAAEEQQV